MRLRIGSTFQREHGQVSMVIGEAITDYRFQRDSLAHDWQYWRFVELDERLTPWLSKKSEAGWMVRQGRWSVLCL